MTQHTGRRPRTDAQRNRAHILAVAEQGFIETGIEVSMDAIAKRAGVGAGTLYRHFPNREELIAAVLTDRGPDLRAEQADIEAQETDSRAALDRWLVAVGTWMQAFEGLPEPLRTAHREQTSPLTPPCQEVIATTDSFLAAAQRDGHARPDVRGVDLYLGTLAAAWAGGADSGDDSVEPGLREMLRRGWSTSTSGE